MLRKVMTIGSLCVALFVGFVSSVSAQEVPGMAKPAKEHKWLAQLAGEWDSECEAPMPGQEPMKAKTAESARMIGGLWLVAESDGEMMGMPVNNVLTLGYDPRREKFVGSWIGSCADHFWTYEGTLDEAGKVLTLETSGPNPMNPSEQANFREVLEVQDLDHKTFTSYIEVDGEWQKMVTVTSTRKK